MKRLWLLTLVLACLVISANAETILVGEEEGMVPSLTQAIEQAADGDTILMASGVYDESRETFPIMVDKAVTISPQEGAVPVIVSPKQTTAMEITGAGATVSGLKFDHIRCAIWVLADDVTVKDCVITLVDETWRTSSSGMWVAGAKRTTLTGCTFTGCSVSVAGPPISDKSVGIPVLTAMFEVGEDIEFFTTHTVENNIVNGEPLCYVIGLHDTVWTEEVGQIIAVECENLTFTGLNLDFASIGIQIAYCQNVTIDKCSANDNGIFGIYIMKTDDCLITHSRADRGAHGIDVRDCDRVTILDCVTNECGQGTFLSWGRNCLVQRCEISNNGTGFFTASGGDNHVADCAIENNDLGLYVQHEKLFTLTDTQVNKNTSCGLRVTDSGVVSLDNSFADNFVAHLALDCYPLTHMRCTWTRSEDCDVYARNGRAIKFIANIFDGEMEDSCQFDGGEGYVFVK